MRIEVAPGGGLNVYIGSTSVGQGMETSLTQIAADALDVPMECIRLFHGSTVYLSEGFGSFHARTVVVGGSAILDAAGKLRQSLREAAARRFGCRPDEVSVGQGLRLSFAGNSFSLQDFPGIRVEGTFASHHHTYANGAAAAHVAVDPETGVVKVLDYVMVEDVGRIINPLTLNGQAIGTAVQGMGGTFFEHLAYDDNGQLLAGSLADYALPIASDFPAIRSIELEDSPSPNNPLGAKGGADGGVIPGRRCHRQCSRIGAGTARRAHQRSAAVAAASVEADP